MQDIVVSPYLLHKGLRLIIWRCELLVIATRPSLPFIALAFRWDYLASQTSLCPEVAQCYEASQSTASCMCIMPLIHTVLHCFIVFTSHLAASVALQLVERKCRWIIHIWVDAWASADLLTTRAHTLHKTQVYPCSHSCCDACFASLQKLTTAHKNSYQYKSFRTGSHSRSCMCWS